MDGLCLEDLALSPALNVLLLLNSSRILMNRPVAGWYLNNMFRPRECCKNINVLPIYNDHYENVREINPVWPGPSLYLMYLAPAEEYIEILGIRKNTSK